MLFPKETYTQRRKALAQRVGSGLILLPGNNNSPANYPGNAYKWRQDSTFLYYWGLQREGLFGVIDCDTQQEWLFGDDIDIEDIVWFGSVCSVADMAVECGASNSGPMSKLAEMITAAKKAGRKIHFLPPYRHDLMIELMDLVGIHPSLQRAQASLELIHAVCDQRAVKTQEEVSELERAYEIGYKMHITAMRMVSSSVTEQEIAGTICGIAESYGCKVSFQSIVSMHGEIMHGYPGPNKLEPGRLLLCDCGAETNENYCSDHTRTTPVDGRFTQRQKEIYSIVDECHDYALTLTRPGARWWDVHFGVCRLMTERLKEIGLMRGDVDEAVAAGAHALFMPHGLGHMMGLDVHDMEGFGQNIIGFDQETQPRLDQFGTNCLRFGRRLQEGFVMTDEPGIYFIPALIDNWKASGHCTEFINFDLLETYKDFGGIRIEDDILITKDGCRFIGDKVIPYHIQDVEEFKARN